MHACVYTQAAIQIQGIMYVCIRLPGVRLIIDAVIMSLPGLYNVMLLFLVICTGFGIVGTSFFL